HGARNKRKSLPEVARTESTLMTLSRSGPAPRKVLILGFSAAVLGLTFFIAWTIFIQPWDFQPPAFDQDCAMAMRDFAEECPNVRGGFVFFPWLGWWRVLAVISAAGVLMSFAFKQRELALGWLTAAVVGGALDFSLKKLFHRERPPHEWRDRAVH